MRALGFGEGGESNTSRGSLKWTKLQLWAVIAALVERGGQCDYDPVLFSATFKGDDTALRAMARAGLIALSEAQPGGRPAVLRAGRPLLQAAYAQMAASPALAGGMGALLRKHEIAEEEAKMGKYQSELSAVAAALKAGAAASGLFPLLLRLVYAPRSEAEQRLTARRRYLLQLVAESQAKVDKLDADRRGFEAMLKKGGAAPRPEVKR